jgi:hypothetical protein
MLNSSVLEVVIGLVFCYASVALIAGYLYEGGVAILGIRAESLLSGVKSMLNDPGPGLRGLALAVYNDALVNPRHDGKTAPGDKPKTLPSYVDSGAFAVALVEAVQALPGEFADMEARINSLPDAQIRQLLLGMYHRAGNKLEGLQVEIATWFDSGMSRVSGVYKRKAQLFTFFIALAVAGLLNIDSFHLFATLWRHASFVGQLSAAGVHDPAKQAVDNLLTLPVGWGQPFHPVACLGWLLTASTALFGAPFWFDILSRLGNLRGSGRSPQEVKKPG